MSSHKRGIADAVNDSAHPHAHALSACEVMMRDPRTLRRNPRNARVHSRKQVNQIAQSLQAFGFIGAIIVDSELRVLAGHGRLEAALALKLERVPTITVSHLSEAQMRAFMLADNKIAENAGWDPSQLAIEFQELAISLPTIELDLSVTGFHAGEVEAILDDRRSAPVAADDLPPAPPAQPTSQPGDVWLLGEHRVICGDIRDAAVSQRLMAGQKADMVFTDPPYNVPIAGHVQGRGQNRHAEFAMASGELSSTDFQAFLRSTLGNLASGCRDGALAFICMDWRHLRELMSAAGEVFDEHKQLIVWNKMTPGQGSFYRSQHELILVYKKGAAAHHNSFDLGQHGRLRSNVWNYPGLSGFGRGRGEALAMHPTVKPLALVKDVLKDCCPPAGLVLDGFLGSGTTLIAAEAVGRRCYGVEIDPGYVDVAIGRWQAMTKREAVLEGTQLTFSEVQRLRERASVPTQRRDAAPPRHQLSPETRKALRLLSASAVDGEAA